MAEEEKKEAKSEKKAPSGNKKDVARRRAARMITNMVIMAAVLTVVGAGLTSVGLSFVFAFFMVAMLPGIVSNILDNRPGRFASKTVMAFNFAGLIPNLTAILASGSPQSMAQSTMYDPKAWLLVYGFAGFGWVVVYMIPHITHLYLEIRANYAIRKMENFQQKLVDEWSEEIKE